MRTIWRRSPRAWQPHPAGRKEERAAQGGSISFSGQLSTCLFVKTGGARLPSGKRRASPGFQRGPCRVLRAHRRAVLADGRSLTVDGRHQSYIIEHAAANMVILQADVKVDQAGQRRI